ncbi:hypothetical protein Q8F55_008248 [Vanrija albida]|uniref:Uncharacterized protein n=1 Tax=Vanrija albida TaxID=181172 RepID=A0ABR3PVQ7_9TREE
MASRQPKKQPYPKYAALQASPGSKEFSKYETLSSIIADYKHLHVETKVVLKALQVHRAILASINDSKDAYKLRQHIRGDDPAWQYVCALVELEPEDRPPSVNAELFERLRQHEAVVTEGYWLVLEWYHYPWAEDQLRRSVTQPDGRSDIVEECRHAIFALEAELEDEQLGWSRRAAVEKRLVALRERMRMLQASLRSAPRARPLPKRKAPTIDKELPPVWKAYIAGTELQPRNGSTVEGRSPVRWNGNTIETQLPPTERWRAVERALNPSAAEQELLAEEEAPTGAVAPSVRGWPTRPPGPCPWPPSPPGPSPPSPAPMQHAYATEKDLPPVPETSAAIRGLYREDDDQRNAHGSAKNKENEKVDDDAASTFSAAPPSYHTHVSNQASAENRLNDAEDRIRDLERRLAQSRGLGRGLFSSQMFGRAFGRGQK